MCEEEAACCGKRLPGRLFFVDLEKWGLKNGETLLLRH